MARCGRVPADGEEREDREDRAKKSDSAPEFRQGMFCNAPRRPSTRPGGRRGRRHSSTTRGGASAAAHAPDRRVSRSARSGPGGCGESRCADARRHPSTSCPGHRFRSAGGRPAGAPPRQVERPQARSTPVASGWGESISPAATRPRFAYCATRHSWGCAITRTRGRRAARRMPPADGSRRIR